MFLWGSSINALVGDSAKVAWTLDGAASERETWTLTSSFGRVYLHPNDAVRSIANWRNGSVLEFEVQGATTIIQRFDLGTMFASPVVDSFDQCVATEHPAQAPSVTDVPLTTEESLRYRAEPLPGSKTVFTSLSLTSASSQVRLSCGIDGLGVQVTGIGAASAAFIPGETVEVTWRIGSGAPQTAIWDAWPFNQSYRISPAADAAFYAAINGADSLSINVASDPVVTQTYGLADNGFWSTPVQPNLDACGDS